MPKLDSVSRPFIRDVIDVVSRVSDVRASAMLRRNGPRRVIEARQLAMHLAFRRFGYSLHRVGNVFSVSHTTVLHGARQVDGRVAADEAFAAFVDALDDELSTGVRATVKWPEPEALPRRVFEVGQALAIPLERLQRMAQLRKKGWSVGGLSRHFDVEPVTIATLFDVPWPGRGADAR